MSRPLPSRWLLGTVATYLALLLLSLSAEATVADACPSDKADAGCRGVLEQQAVFGPPAGGSARKAHSSCLLQQAVAVQSGMGGIQTLATSSIAGADKSSRPIAEHQVRATQPSRTATQRLQSVSDNYIDLVTAETLGEALSYGRDIWNQSRLWGTLQMQHPQGVVTNVVNGTVTWAKVPFMSAEALVGLSLLAYPAAFLALASVAVLLMGLCLSPRSSTEPPTTALLSSALVRSPCLSPAELAPFSRCAYALWVRLCCCFPALLVFGSPLAMVALSYVYPQETFILLMVTTFIWSLTNGVHMAVFGQLALSKMERAMTATPNQLLWGAANHGQWREVIHWLVLPNYAEDLEILSATLRAASRSTVAKSQVCVLLAMEGREAASEEKASTLIARFQSEFREVCACYHPPNLANDPPGKASNTSYAFGWLCEHTRSITAQEVLLTVADADSELHETYFENLTRAHLDAEEDKRGMVLWQTPVLHMKNYHRQPGMVVVGTMFTCMSQCAELVDPNAVRFPYSTYALPMSLARQVGGWDPDWISEDWHMGLKCFLMTRGRVAVETLHVPTLNYTPEEASWSGTVWARWVQAKRHALGFSDLSYFFMMLPLVFAHVRTATGKGSQNSTTDILRLAGGGLSLVIRIVNTHVVLGTLTLFFILDILLKQAMRSYLPDTRNVGDLFERTRMMWSVGAWFTFVMMCVTASNFSVLYQQVKDRLEPCGKSGSGIFHNPPLHWLYSLGCFLAFGSLYFVVLGAATWIAAVRVLGSRNWEYEVASKPTMSSRLGEGELDTEGERIARAASEAEREAGEAAANECEKESDDPTSDNEDSVI